MIDTQAPRADSNHVSATARFVLAAVCCVVFVVSVLVLARVTAGAPVKALREVAFTFWGVAVNFALCLGTVAYVSRRLQQPRKARAGER